MLEGLQTIPRDDRTDTTVIEPAQLIIDNEYARVVADFVRSAKSEIRLCAYAWRWYKNEPETDIQKLNIELLLARSRGVKVRILVDTELQKLTFTTLGFDARSVVNTRMLHTKAISIDDRTLILGSHNMTKRATTDNYEMSLATSEYQVVAAYMDYFDRMWHSRG